MSRRHLLGCAIGIVMSLGLSSGAHAQPPRAARDDEAAIRRARADQNAAIAAHEFDRVASHWTEDVSITAGLGRVLRGRAAYRQAFQLDSGMTYERTPGAVEISEAWPLAFETGTWVGRRAGGDGTPLLRGRYSAQWVKVERRWLIRSEVFVALGCSGEACRWPAAAR